MGKERPSFILETVFKDITNIENIIKNSKKVQQHCKQVNFSSTSEVQKLFEDTKSIVSSIKDEATKIDDYFHENYRTWQNQLNDLDKNTSEDIAEANSKDSEATNETQSTSDKCETVDEFVTKRKTSKNQLKDGDANVAAVNSKDSQAHCEIQNTNSDKAETIDKPITERISSENQAKTGDDVDVAAGNSKESHLDLETQNAKSNEDDIINKSIIESKNSDQPNQGSDQSNKDCNTDILTDSIKDTEADCVLQDTTYEKENGIDESVIQSEVSKRGDDVDVESSSTVNEDQKPFIKCVDIKKLVKPNILPCVKSPPPTKQIVALNTTILIVSDSDTDDSNSRIKNPKRSSRNASISKLSARSTNSDINKDSKTASKDTFSAKGKTLGPATLGRRTNEVVVNSEQKSDKRRKLPIKNKRDRKVLDNEGSSTSGSEIEIARKTTQKKSSKSKKSVKEDIDPSLDIKFRCKAHVPLPRIPCEKLKEHYLTMTDLQDVQKLTNLKTLKRLRCKSDSNKNSSSESEKISSKKKRKTDGKKPCARSNSSNSESENNTSKKEDEPKVANIDDKIDKPTNEAMLLDDIRSASESSSNENEKESVEQNENENKGKSKKNRSEKDKEEVKKSEDKQENCHEDTNETNKKGGNSKWRKDKLLTERLPNISSDSEDEVVKFKRQSGNLKKDSAKKVIQDANRGSPASSDNENKEKANESDQDKKKDHTDENESDQEGKKKYRKKSKNKENECEDGDTDTSEKNNKDKSLTLSNLSSNSESEDELVKFKKHSSKVKENAAKKVIKKRTKQIIASSDSENDEKTDESDSEASDSSESENEKSNKKVTEEDKDTKKRRRIKRVDSSSDEENKSTRKTIRKMIAHDSLAETTKQAEKDEKERKSRIAERQKKYNQMFEGDKPQDASVDKLVLDFNEETKKELLSVDKNLVNKLKPHQAKGIQFMWDACYESLERTKTTDGSGCILAHCMGLGKTLQVIGLIHTLLTNRETKVEKVLVVTPLNTVLNWVAEFKKWLRGVDGPDIDIYDLVSGKQIRERKYKVEGWASDGGVLILGYDMFRNLTNPTNKRLKKHERASFEKCLVNPGPDLVICDEGHLLKNEKSNLSIAMNRIRTARRIVLTGTPMQNNLKEYYCMVQFVKPNLLGTYKEYLNRFVNPVTNGQYTDSTEHDINIMRKRSHVLHKLLDGVVQRKDYSVLTPYLPPKYEYVLFLTLSEAQINLYRHYLENFSRRPVEDAKMRTTFLFNDFQVFQRICTHPRTLLLKSEADAKKAIDYDTDESEGSLKDFINDDDSDTPSSSSSSSDADSDASGSVKSIKSNSEKKVSKRRGRITRNTAATKGIEIIDEPLPERERKEQWWDKLCSEKELEDIALSTKLYLLFDILQECELIGDKLLVFSQSLYSLNIIEYFLDKIDEATQNSSSEKVCGFSGSWAVGQDYFRLDGSSSCDNRSAWCKSFNNPDNPRARLFLISTRAGGLGINLVGANRVVIFDVSWNPSHDIQSIYRVYRFGQTKPCYIYRFVTNGTMEMKIYERQVTKQAISKRVIDEQQIDRHYNQNDLAELYLFEPKPEEQPTPLVPKDVLLAELLQKEKNKIFTYHEHQTLLENKEDEELNEEERKAAWEEFENEKTLRATSNTATGGWINNLPIAGIRNALLHILSKDNPTWTRDQINSVIPIIVQQLKEQVEKGDMVLYSRIVNQLRELQIAQQRRMQEYYMQQQIRLMQQQLVQRQQMSTQQLMQQGLLNSHLAGPSFNRARSRTAGAGIQPTEIVDLDVNEV